MSNIPANSNIYQLFHPILQTATQFKIESHPQLAQFLQKSGQRTHSKKTLSSRSKKKYANLSHQISFEDGFLQQHMMAFRFFYQKYCYQASKSSKSDSLKIQFEYCSNFEGFSYCLWLEKELDKIYGTNSAQRMQLYEDWAKEQNIVRFLKFISNGVKKILIPQFFILIAFIWQNYVQAVQKCTLQTQIYKEMENAIIESYQRIYQSQKLSNLTLGNCNNQQIIESFEQFLKHLSMTVYLIIEGYFSNPLSQEPQMELDEKKLSAVDKKSQEKNDGYLASSKMARKMIKHS